jgi:hypothetical protein
MEYGKIENGNIRKYQSILQENGGVIYSPTHEQWIENGYLPIIENRPDERDGFWLSERYEQRDNEIVCTYEFNVVEVSDVNV